MLLRSAKRVGTLQEGQPKRMKLKAAAAGSGKAALSQPLEPPEQANQGPIASTCKYVPDGNAVSAATEAVRVLQQAVPAVPASKKAKSPAGRAEHGSRHQPPPRQATSAPADEPADPEGAELAAAVGVDSDASPSILNMQSVEQGYQQELEKTQKQLQKMQGVAQAAQGASSAAGWQMKPAFCPEQPQLHIGTSGFSYKWWYSAGSAFTAPGRTVSSDAQLAYYMQFFNAVELNVTFYRWMGASSWHSWRLKAGAQSLLNPANPFQYIVKAHQFFTHQKKLTQDESFLQRWDSFHDNCSSLGKHLGPILFQFPPSFHATSQRGINNLARLEALVELLRKPKYAQVEYAFEFRNSSWYKPAVYDILRQHGNAAMVLVHAVDGGERSEDGTCWFGDTPNGWHPQLESDPLTANRFSYLRLHGTGGQFKGSYGLQELSKVAKMLNTSTATNGRRAYVFFNNTDDCTCQPTNMPSSAVQDALLLGDALRAYVKMP